MKTVRLVLLATYMFLAHIPSRFCRPVADLNFFRSRGSTFSVRNSLNEPRDEALVYLLRDRLLKYLEEEDPALLSSLSQMSSRVRVADQPLSTAELARLVGSAESLTHSQVPIGEASNRIDLDNFQERLKREDPPISIDLTFHILRQMIEIAKTQSQKQKAEQNRIIFDSVGK
ncbi:urocortin [Protopterus annectens]|uniref:urocortin n=1 Tax=Protopterus annectens TaxID=7888 RepID=UPI001CFA15AA|nr:urocortin [Protopterus annectens]